MIEKPESIQGYNLSQKANNGFICLDEVLEPAQCVFNQQNVSYGQSRAGMSIHEHNESLKGFSR